MAGKRWNTMTVFTQRSLHIKSSSTTSKMICFYVGKQYGLDWFETIFKYLFRFSEFKFFKLKKKENILNKRTRFVGNTYREDIDPTPCCNDERVENEKGELKKHNGNSVFGLNPWGGGKREESTREQNGSRYHFCPTHYRRPVEHAMGSLSTFLHPSLFGVGVFVALIARTCAPRPTPGQVYNVDANRVIAFVGRLNVARSVRDLKTQNRYSRRVPRGLFKNMENPTSSAAIT